MQTQRRNFRLAVANGVVMIGSNTSLSSPELVLTAFAAHLTDNPLILGLIAPLYPATWTLPQLWMVGRLNTARRALPFYTVAALVRVVAWIGLIITMLLVRDNTVLLVALLLHTVVAGTAAGFAGLPFTEVVAKTIQPRQRGLVFGLRNALGGALGILGAQVVILLTGPGSWFDFPVNYALLFLLALVVQSIGIVCFAKIKEPSADPKQKHLQPSLGVLRKLWHTDANLRHFLRGRTYFVLSSMANGLIIVYGNHVLGVRLELAGVYLVAGTVMRPIMALVGGRLSMRFGSRLPVSAGLVVQAFTWGLLLVAHPLGIQDRAAEYFLFVIYSLYAAQAGLVASSLMALGLNVVPTQERALYLGAVNTFVGLVTLVSAFSGAVVELTGFDVLFAITMLFACLAGWEFWLLNEKLEAAPDGSA